MWLWYSPRKKHTQTIEQVNKKYKTKIDRITKYDKWYEMIISTKNSWIKIGW